MGVRFIEAAFLMDCLHNGVRLGRCLTIGRQNLICSRKQLVAALGRYGRTLTAHELDRIFTTFVHLPNNTYSGNLFCEPLFEMLGAASVESADFSNYEKATLIHDFNVPLPEQFAGAFDTVVDFGTLEHIFNVPIALRNMLHAVKPGGFYLAALPCNNLPGHGLYQFSPELFFSVLIPQNGFSLDRLLVSEEITKYRFRRIPDPHVTRARVTFTNSKETSIFLCARRVGEVPQFLSAYQSDYEALWENASVGGSSGNRSPSIGLRSLAAALYRRIVPEPVRRVRQRLLEWSKHRPRFRDFSSYP